MTAKPVIAKAHNNDQNPGLTDKEIKIYKTPKISKTGQLVSQP